MYKRVTSTMAKTRSEQEILKRQVWNISMGQKGSRSQSPTEINVDRQMEIENVLIQRLEEECGYESKKYRIISSKPRGYTSREIIRS